jgi:hypothetical protein
MGLLSEKPDWVSDERTSELLKRSIVRFIGTTKNSDVTDVQKANLASR